ncbi:MAG: hypothetical protein ACYC35_27470 [Pirellulales bacterium]
MKLAAVLLATLMVNVAIAEDVQRKENEVPAKELSANRMARLVGAATSPSPVGNLGAKFVEIKPNAGKVIGVPFPSHRLTTHEETLIRIIESSTAWGQEQQGLHQPQFEVVFSMPQFPEGHVSDYKFERWYLVSIKPLEVKKDRPKAWRGYAAGKDHAGDGPILPFFGPQHRAMKLLAVRYRESREHNLLAKFAEVGPQRGREIELDLGGPIQPVGDQTTADVAHTRTILNIIKSSVSGTPLPDARSDVAQWRKPVFEVIFAVPKDAQGKVSDFSRWSFLSIKMPEPKKAQPKPSDK